MSFILRYDDICEYTPSLFLDELHKICKSKNIRPILACIPEVKDSNILKLKKNEKYKYQIKELYELGVEIACHGFDHKMKKIGSNSSEMTLYNYAEQKHRLEKSLGYFDKLNIKVRGFIPPNHNLNLETIKALSDLKFNWLSSGLFTNFIHIKEYNLDIYPNYLWNFRKFPINSMVCFHPNFYSQDMINNNISILKRKIFISLNDIKKSNNDSFNNQYILNMIYKLKFKKSFPVYYKFVNNCLEVLNS